MVGAGRHDDGFALIGRTLGGHFKVADAIGGAGDCFDGRHTLAVVNFEHLRVGAYVFFKTLSELNAGDVLVANPVLHIVRHDGLPAERFGDEQR